MVLTSVMITHFGIAVTVTMGLILTNIHMPHYAPVTTTPKVLKSLEEIAVTLGILIVMMILKNYVIPISIAPIQAMKQNVHVMTNISTVNNRKHVYLKPKNVME